LRSRAVALAAAGRNPTDIPALVDSEGSGDGGGGDDAIMGGPGSGSTAGSSSAAQPAASENGSGTEVASAGNSSSAAASSTSASTAASGSSGASSGLSGSSGGSSGSSAKGTSSVVYAGAGGSSSGATSSSTSTSDSAAGSTGPTSGGGADERASDGPAAGSLAETSGVLSDLSDDDDGSHLRAPGAPVSMNQRAPRAQSAGQAIAASKPPGDRIMGMTPEANAIDNHALPEVSPEDHANAVKFLVGMTLITGSGGAATPIVIRWWLIAKGVDEIQAAVRGQETVVYQGAVMFGASDQGARVVDVFATMPELPVAAGRGLLTATREMAVQTAGRGLVLSAEEAGTRAAGAAAAGAAKGFVENPQTVLKAGGKVLAEGEGAAAGARGLAPKSGLGGATRLSADELATGQRLATQLGKSLKESPHVGADYVDDLGRSYDALGGFDPKFFNEKSFLRQIDKHLLKSNDFTVIDLTGFSQAQIDAVRRHLSTLSSEQLKRIIQIGF
jgi:hypothetical protein